MVWPFPVTPARVSRLCRGAVPALELDHEPHAASATGSALLTMPAAQGKPYKRLSSWIRFSRSTAPGPALLQENLQARSSFEDSCS